MKKILTLAAVSLVVGLGFSSCLKAEPDQYEPIRPGVDIYNIADNQNAISMMPISEVIRLNMLLADSVKQKSESLDDVEYKKTNVKKALFSTAVRSIKADEERRVFTMTYGAESPYSRPVFDGVIEIDTGGKLLDELEDGDLWTITTRESTGDMFTRFVYDGYSGALAYSLEYDNGIEYSISKSGEGPGWDIKVVNSKVRYVSSYTSSDNKVTSDWTASHTLKLSDGDLSYSGTRDSDFSYSGHAAGKITSGVEMTYAILEDMVYEANSSGGHYIVEGKEKVAFAPSAEIDETHYPSRVVEVEWVEVGTGTSTGVYRSFTYNGTTMVYPYYW